MSHGCRVEFLGDTSRFRSRRIAPFFYFAILIILFSELKEGNMRQIPSCILHFYNDARFSSYLEDGSFMAGQTQDYRNGMSDALKNFFGVSSAYAEPDKCAITCGFVARSSDGAGEEKRSFIISTQNSPEQNMQILLSALAQKRWYETCRDGSQFIRPQRDEKGEFELALDTPKTKDDDDVVDLDDYELELVKYQTEIPAKEPV